MEANQTEGRSATESERPTGFVINGKEYPVPTLDTFDMDEAQVLYDYAEIALEDFGPPAPDWSPEEKQEHEQNIMKKAKNPAFKRALLHVAYARGNRDVTHGEIKEIVGHVNILEATLVLFGGDASPPETTASQSSLESVSDSTTISSTSDSGGPFRNDSGALVAIPGRIGTTESDTSSQAFVPTG